MIACCQIIKLNSQVEGNAQSHETDMMISARIKKTQTLVMVEFIDAILPLAFGISFTMAYYGPNVALMTSIGNNYFGGKAIENVQHVYIAMFQMFAFDLFSVLICGVSLNDLCGIDLFHLIVPNS